MLLYLSLPFVCFSIAGALLGAPENVNFDHLSVFASANNVTIKDCPYNKVSEKGIFYNLYSREGFLLHAENITSEITSSFYHVNKPTKIVVHGWLQSSNAKEFQQLVHNYLYIQDVNVITMDWSVYSSCKLQNVAEDVTMVAAESLAALMKSLIVYGTNATDIHVIAFGAASHIAGVAGKVMHPHMIGRITALQPMGQLFDHSGYPKLHTGDAHFVDVIYTAQDKGVYSSKREVGHAIFYPNGGRFPQPGCGSEEPCSIMKSVEYYSKSILYPNAYPAKRIQKWSELKDIKDSEDLMASPDNFMGEYTDSRKPGKYYVSVKNFESADYFSKVY